MFSSLVLALVHPAPVGIAAGAEADEGRNEDGKSEEGGGDCVVHA